ncbi:WD40 repeat domain-containing protein [Neolewinella lacunae]|uniref:WD40 repeat domain-containing protein n=1 Tax=Neolewinella lacunae TaxID=1517758 RepID=A0A923PTR7_9BACT|nr:WD40 repeat domain-containing protein [Neolewinella lacunae]MBC6996667.1 WD40 repeat domain-containing protein [Neolewinella lacunae]MDN3634768.1 WD40 repeat domain-containing protein [Neolewinella lacunae]
MSSTLTQLAPFPFPVVKPWLAVTRSEALLDMTQQLTRPARFVALRGEGGSGKSYFLHRQFIDYLTSQEAEASDLPWRVVAFSPQINPLGRLASALAQPGILQGQKVVQPFFHERIAAALRHDNEGLVRVVREARAASTTPFRLLIIVDQLEEMFRIGEVLRHRPPSGASPAAGAYQPGDEVLFFNLFLKALREDVPVHIVFSIGTEYLDRLNAYQGWPEIVGVHRYTLPAISVEDLSRELLAKPFPANVQPFSPALANCYARIVADYQSLSGKQTELAARINMALHLLGQEEPRYLATFWNQLPDPPDFLARNLPLRADAPLEEIAALRELANLPANRIAWSEYVTTLNPTQREDYHTAVAAYGQKLLAHYTRMGGLNGVPDFFYTKHFTDRVAAFPPPEASATLLARIFQAVTLKDPSPDRVAANYPLSFGRLRGIAFRSASGAASTNGATHGMGDDAEKEQLRQIVAAFTFPNHNIPNLLQWATPHGKIQVTAAELDDSAIISLGPARLIQEWRQLTTWVEEEYKAATLYVNLVEEAKEYYQQSIHSQPSAAPPAPFQRPSLLKELWGRLTGFVRQLRGTKAEPNTGQKELDKTLLSEGRVELVEHWANKLQPNTEWAEKYRARTVLTPEEAAANPGFAAWLTEHQHHAFSLATAFYEASRDYHLQRRREKEEYDAYELRRQQTRAKRAIYTTIIVLILGVAAVVLGLDARRTKNNLTLLDFVDAMAKANLMSNDIYRTDAFKRLKIRIEDGKAINREEIVIDSLVRWGLLDLQQPYAPHGHHSRSTLLLLSNLLDNYHQREARQTTFGRFFRAFTRPLGEAAPADLFEVSQAIAAEVDTVLRRQQTPGHNHYQYPYIFHVLWENVGALQTQLEREKFLDGRAFFYRSHARYNAMAAHPVSREQFAAGDATGQVRIFFRASGRNVALASVGKSISSILYSEDGNDLYVSTFSGEIYRYRGLNDEVGLATRRDSLPFEALALERTAARKNLAILSVQRTAREDCLLLLGDADVSLIQLRPGSNSYRESSVIPLTQTLKAVTLVRGNGAGSHFVVGGSAGSVLLAFGKSANGVGGLQPLRWAEHPNLSVSAIAFDGSRSPEPIALGSEDGRIWLTDRDNYTVENPHSPPSYSPEVPQPFQYSAISQLSFNRRGNHQLISSSLDGSVWIFNLDAHPFATNSYLEDTPHPGDVGPEDAFDSAAWDHLRLPTNGHSVTTFCLVNDENIALVENNVLRLWPTNLLTLREEFQALLDAYRSPNE